MHAIQEPIYFIHMSDTHIGPTREFERHGYRSWPAAREAIALIKSFKQPLDFVVHTGDIVTDPDANAFALAADLMADLDLPVYYSVGNHDTAVGIKRHFRHGPFEPLGDEPNRHVYAFQVKGCEFVMLDGRAADELDPNGCLGARQLDLIRKKTQEETPKPLIFFVHFPALPLNSPWFDKNMLLLDGEKLHELLSRSPRPVRGVFHGHIHMPLQTSRDGVLYSAAPSTFANFAAWPESDGPEFLIEPPGFTFVQVLPDQILIRHHGFSRP